MAKISDNFKKLIDGIEGYEIPDTTPFLCSYALYGLNYEEIIIPESVVRINKNAIPNTIKNVKVIGNNLVSYFGWDANKKYAEIPNGVRELNQQSCYGNPKTIFVPSSVCYIHSGDGSDTFNAIPSNVDVMCIDKPSGSLYGSPFRISNPPKKLIWKDEPSLFIKTGENNEVIIDNGDIKELTRGYKGNIGDEVNVEIIKYGYVNSIRDNITLTDELTIKEYNFEKAIIDRVKVEIILKDGKLFECIPVKIIEDAGKNYFEIIQDNKEKLVSADKVVSIRGTINKFNLKFSDEYVEVSHRGFHGNFHDD